LVHDAASRLIDQDYKAAYACGDGDQYRRPL